MTGLSHALSRRFVRSPFARDARGAAAVEFALITPVLLLMFFGTVELSTGVAIDRKVTLVARALSDLVAQAVDISDSDMTNVFSASSSILTPYSVTPLTAEVTAVTIDGNGNATVAWSNSWTNASGMSSGYAAGTNVTSLIPAGLIVNNTELIWSQASFAYTPVVGYVVKSTITLSDQFFSRPRQSTTVARTS